MQANEIGNPISFDIGILISFEVKRKQDRNSYLVRDKDSKSHLVDNRKVANWSTNPQFKSCISVSKDQNICE